MNTLIEIDTSELVGLVGDLNDAAGVLNAGAAAGVNRVASRVRKDTVRKIVSQVYLGETYVDGKVLFDQPATSTKPQAVLEVPDEPVSLANYNAKQKIQSNVWTAAKYAAAFGTLAAPVRLPSGKMAQWIPRKGDDLRSINVGSKQAGITAGISRGRATSTFSHMFFMPILSGKVQAGRWGSFSRPKGGGKPQARYGPSPYQVTKGVWRDGEDEISELMGLAISEEVTDRITNALRTT